MNRNALYLILFTLVLGSSFMPLCAVSKEKNKFTPMKWEFAVVTMFRDEARYLKEWIEFHKLAGAEHFYLYNHLSVDNYLEVLQPYIDSGEVELIEWTYQATSMPSFLKIQRNAFRDAIARANGNANWLAILDTDEFLFTLDGIKVQDQLRPLLTEKQYNSTVGGVKVRWLLFGTSNVAKIPKDRTLIETLTMCKGRKEKGKKGCKTICRPDKVKVLANVHWCDYQDGFEAIQDDESSFGKNLQFNHYWARDEDFFLNVKIARKKEIGNIGESSNLKKVEELSAVQDTAILRYVPALRKKLGLPSLKN